MCSWRAQIAKLFIPQYCILIAQWWDSFHTQRLQLFEKKSLLIKVNVFYMKENTGVIINIARTASGGP
jgi:hypothetical protein